MQIINLRNLLSLIFLSLAFPIFAKSPPIGKQASPKKFPRVAYLGMGPNLNDGVSQSSSEPEPQNTDKLRTHKKNNIEAKKTNKTKTVSKSDTKEAVKPPIKKKVQPNPAPTKTKPVKKRLLPSTNTIQHSPQFYMGAYGGYGVINGAYENDGQFTQGRIAVGVQTAQTVRYSFGLEASVQWGNEMRLSASPSEIEDAGGSPIQTTLKPLVDLLLTFKKQITMKPLFVVLKGGIAYRQLQFMNLSSSQDNLRKINGEFQAGLSYKLNNHTALTVFYQGIYAGSDAGVYLDNENNVLMRRIPTQQAGFLGLEYSV